MFLEKKSYRWDSGSIIFFRRDIEVWFVGILSFKAHAQKIKRAFPFGT